MNPFKEVCKIMEHLNFGLLTQDMDAVEEANRALLRATAKHIPQKGKLSTIKFTSVKNACIGYMRKIKGPKHLFHRHMIPINTPENPYRSHGGLKNGISERIPFKEIPVRDDFDPDKLIKYIQHTPILNSRSKRMLLDKFIYGMGTKELMQKYKICDSRVGALIRESLDKIKEVATKEMFLT